MEIVLGAPILLILLVIVILLIVWMVPVRLWVEAVFAGVKVSLGSLIGMRRLMQLCSVSSCGFLGTERFSK